MNTRDLETAFVSLRMNAGRSELKEVWRMNRTSIKRTGKEYCFFKGGNKQWAIEKSVRASRKPTERQNSLKNCIQYNRGVWASQPLTK